MTPALVPSAAGEWRKLTLSPPFAAQAGDIVGSDASGVFVLRGGVKVAEWPLNTPGAPAGVVPFPSAQVLSELAYFHLWRRYMAVKTITGVSVAAAPSTVVRFNFSDGSQREVASHADGVTLADTLDGDGDLAERVLVAKAYRHSPDGTALADAIGSSCTIDTAAETPVQVSLSGALS